MTLIHGHNTRKFGPTPTYRSWYSMITRCQNPNRRAYADYGGRGITVCEHWLTFENFLADMGVRPEGLSLDRIDNAGNYEPGNCKWSTRLEQNRNRRPIARRVACRRGHVYTEKTTYSDHKGWRRCRVCDALRQRELRGAR